MTPEDLDGFFDDASNDRSADAEQSPLKAYFPVSVIERLRRSSVDDLGRCLALAVFREQAKQRMDGWVVANRVTRTHPGP